MDFCHSQGVYHRDLKVILDLHLKVYCAITVCNNSYKCFIYMQPENLLLDSLGNLKISDFGLSALPEQVRFMIKFIPVSVGCRV